MTKYSPKQKFNLPVKTRFTLVPGSGCGDCLANELYGSVLAQRARPRRELLWLFDLTHPALGNYGLLHVRKGASIEASKRLLPESKPCVIQSAAWK